LLLDNPEKRFTVLSDKLKDVNFYLIICSLGIPLGHKHKSKYIDFFLLGLRCNTNTSRTTCPEIWTKDPSHRILVHMLTVYYPDATGSWNWWLGSCMWNKSDSRTFPGKSFIVYLVPFSVLTTKGNEGEYFIRNILTRNSW